MSNLNKSVKRNIFNLTSPYSIHLFHTTDSNFRKIGYKFGSDKNTIQENTNEEENNIQNWKNFTERSRKTVASKMERPKRLFQKRKLNLINLSNSNSAYTERENARLRDEHRLLSFARRNKYQ